MVELTGRVTYRTRQALPPGATVDVRLLDVSRVDVPAQELGRIVIVTKGEQVPVPFAIRYDANAIDARRRYTVQATITIDGPGGVPHDDRAPGADQRRVWHRRRGRGRAAALIVSRPVRTTL